MVVFFILLTPITLYSQAWWWDVYVQQVHPTVAPDSIVGYTYTDKGDSTQSFKEIYSSYKPDNWHRISYQWDDLLGLWSVSSQTTYYHQGTDLHYHYEVWYPETGWSSFEEETQKYDPSERLKTTVQYYGYDDWGFENKRILEYYDVNKRKIISQTFGDSEEVHRTTWEFDDNIRKSTETHFVQDWESLQMRPEIRWERYRDANDQDTLTIRYRPELNGNELLRWKEIIKTSTQYSLSGALLRKAEYFADWQEEEFNGWEINSYFSLEYDEQNRLSHRRYYKTNPNTGEVVPQEWVDYQYNDRDQVTQTLTYVGDNSDDWTLSRKTENEYDSHGNQLSQFRYNWRDENWTMFHKETWEYNSLNRLLSNTSYGLLSSGGRLTLFPNILTEYFYDEFGNQSGQQVSERGVNDSDWKISHKRSTILDQNKNRLSYVSYMWNENLQELKPESGTFYFYPASSGVFDNKTDNTIVYPNPSSGYIRIKGLLEPKQVLLFSPTGQLVFDQLVFDRKIDISMLKKGNYILRIPDTGFGQMIIKN